MRRLLLAFLVLAALIPAQAPAQTAGGCPGVTRPTLPYAKEILTVSTVAIGFTPSVMTGGNHAPSFAEVSTETDALRYFVDGSTPTSSQGHLVPANAVFLVCGQAIGRFKAIRVTSDVTITVTYFQ